LLGSDTGAGSEFLLPDGTILDPQRASSDAYKAFADAWRVPDSASLFAPVMKLVGTADADGNGQADILYSKGGSLALWANSGGKFSQASVPNAHMGAEWTAYGTGDFSGDGRTGVLWTNTTGQVAIWTLNGTVLTASTVSDGHMGAEWHVAGINDFNGD